MYEAQRKYAKKTYKQYTIYLRKDNDHDLITFVEEQQQNGKNISEIFRQMVECYQKYKE